MPLNNTPSAVVDRRLSIEELPQYLSVDEVQSYLDIGRSSAYEFARVHGKRFGKLLRVPREALAR